MKTRLFRIGGMIAACVILALPASAESWRETGCDGIVDEELAKLDLSGLGKRDINYIVTSYGAAASDQSEGFSGWISFENCKGNLVVQLSNSCNIAQIYTVGECRVEGIHHY